MKLGNSMMGIDLESSCVSSSSVQVGPRFATNRVEHGGLLPGAGGGGGTIPCVVFIPLASQFCILQSYLVGVENLKLFNKHTGD